MDPNKKYRVLMVDDDQFLLNMYAVKMAASGFDVSTASSGEMTLRKLREGYIPEVIILDIVMPGMDGLELLENIRQGKLAEKAIVIILTNQSHSADVERAKKLGVSGYIVKASSIPSEVLEEVQKIIKKSNI